MNLQTRIPISNGTSIPCVGFGTWKTPNEEAEKSVARQSQNPALREKTFS